MSDRTWGEWLRFYRRQARDHQRGGPLTQNRLADLLAEQYGVIYSRAAISDWERDQARIHIDDRNTLTYLIKLLHDCQGIQTITQANNWLMTGNYRPLDEQERLVISVTWHITESSNSQSEALQRYKTQMVARYGTMQIFGQPEPKPLREIYTDVYIHDRPTAWRRFNREELEKQFTRWGSFSRRDKQRRAGLELVKERQRLYILGQPGAGKTTFLKYLLLQAIQGKLERLPIFVTLKELTDAGQSLFDFIVVQFEQVNFSQAEQFITELLRKGQALLLLDGLDEVTHEGATRLQLAREIQQFVAQHNQNQFVLTCRVAADEYTFEGFNYVEMADFSDKQVAWFVENWFAGESQQRDFLAELKGNRGKGVQEMAQTPLLLTMLCLTFEGRLSLPTRRVEIYEEALDALLKKWDSSRQIMRDEIYKTLSLRRKQQLLARLAYETFVKGELFIPAPRLEKLIVDYFAKVPPYHDPLDIEDKVVEAVLKASCAQHGLLVEQAKGIYSFSHLAFQEYFTAKYIADSEAWGTVQALIPHYGDSRWREVFLLTASLLDEADNFFEHYLARLRQLVARDDQLIAFFAWLVRRATEKPLGSTPLASRWGFLYLSLARALDLDLALDLAPARTLDLARALDLAPARALDLTYALAFDRVRTRTRALDLVLVPFEIMQNMAKQMGWVELAQALQQLVIPKRWATSAIWEAFARQLEQIIDKVVLGGIRWEFTREQAKRLAEYVEAADLLLQCLDLATVTDREAIENQLFLPPNVLQ